MNPAHTIQSPWMGILSHWANTNHFSHQIEHTQTKCPQNSNWHHIWTRKRIPKHPIQTIISLLFHLCLACTVFHDLKSKYNISTNQCAQNNHRLLSSHKHSIPTEWMKDPSNILPHQQAQHSFLCNRTRPLPAKPLDSQPPAPQIEIKSLPMPYISVISTQFHLQYNTD